MTEMKGQVPVITIDGPTASGKGTVASKVAEALGFHYLDSGALYRIVGLVCLRANVDLKDIAAVTAHAMGISPVSWQRRHHQCHPHGRCRPGSFLHRCYPLGPQRSF